MLTATFSVFKGLTCRSELMLWQRGFFSWKEFQILKDSVPLSKRKIELVLKEMDEATIALNTGLMDWFLNRLENEDKPRVYPHCKDAIRYIDIETTGLAKTSQITTIAVYDGTHLHAYVKDINLQRFPESLADTKLMVTYNGGRFDLPFLRKRFGLDLAFAHIDLIRIAKAYGYSGGLKACEKKMGIQRGAFNDIDGHNAISLWQRFKEYGEKNVLKKLVVYNFLDVLSLETILIRLYNQSMCRWPHFKKHPLPVQPDPLETFQLLFDK